MKYIARITQMTVLPEGEPTFCERATTITIVDESAGEFLEIKQNDDQTEPGKIRLDLDEWNVFRDTMGRMFEEIRKHEKTNLPDLANIVAFNSQHERQGESD